MAKVDTLPAILVPLMSAPSIRLDRCAVCGRYAPLNQHHMVRRGAGRLYRAGVEVETGVLKAECDALNYVFFHYITTGKPYIVDGRRRAGESDSEYAVRRRELYATYAAVLAGTESDVPDESFAHFNGPVQAVGADEVVIGGHRPLLLEAGALACTDPDEWLRELGKRKIDGLIVESDEAFERLSMACQKD